MMPCKEGCMRKLVLVLLLVVVSAGTLPIYGRRHHDLNVTINKEVAGKGGIKVAFIELVEDARCPTDVQCVWAGNAKIKIRVTKNGRSKVLELNTSEPGAAPAFGGYSFKLKGLTPELRSNVRINRNAYEATIEMSKVK
jgi:hypothetical protein